MSNGPRYPETIPELAVALERHFELVFQRLDQMESRLDRIESGIVLLSSMGRCLENIERKLLSPSERVFSGSTEARQIHELAAKGRD